MSSLKELQGLIHEKFGIDPTELTPEAIAARWVSTGAGRIPARRGGRRYPGQADGVKDGVKLPVVITGLGVVAPHGDDPQAMFGALLRGESALRPVFPALPTPAAAAIVEFDPARWFTKLQLAGVDRASATSSSAPRSRWFGATRSARCASARRKRCTATCLAPPARSKR